MINVRFLFPKSADSKELDDFLSSQFIPAHKQALGLRSLKISAGDLMSPGGPPPYAKIVEASFDSLNDVMAAVQSQTQDARDSDEGSRRSYTDVRGQRTLTLVAAYTAKAPSSSAGALVCPPHSPGTCRGCQADSWIVNDVEHAA